MYFCFLKEKRMLEVNNISIQFGDEEVLCGFTCRVEKGQFACIKGKSGCGKTSLLKALIGLSPFDGGTIRVGGEILNEITCNIIRKNTAYLPQELSFPNEDVNDIIVQTLRIGGIKDVRLYTSELYNNLRLLGLDQEMLDRRMSEISGGQRQRVMLAAIALLDKQVWLLDEPTAALDKDSRDLVIDFLLAQQRRGKTIVAVSHDEEFAARCSALIQID